MDILPLLKIVFLRYFVGGMGKVNTSYFLARRLRAGEGGRRNSVMSRIATLSVTIGLAVMIVALGVIFGFKREITEKMTGVMSHVQITRLERSTTFQSDPISDDQPFVEDIRRLPGFVSMHRYAQTPGILRGEESFQGILLKGIGADFDRRFFEAALVEGELPVVGDSIRNKDILISKRLAQMMNLAVGDRIELMFLEQPPRRDAYKIVGLYRTDMQQIDNLWALTDIRNVQRLNRWAPDQITGFEIMTTDFGHLAPFSDEVYGLLSGMSDRIIEPLMVSNLRESHPMIFDWLETHDLNALIIIVVMLLVAIFNMIAALLILILEKIPLIGTLKTLGMTDGAIRLIFVYRSGRIALRGMLWGNAAGLGFCWLQQATGWLTLDADGYFLTTVPIHIDWGAIGLLNVGVFAVIVLVQILPARIVSRILPEKAIRFD